MAQSSPLRAVLLAAALFGLAGCGASDLARSFGLTRDAPDEFTVTTRAPLSMPPDYTLRPPRPGEARPQEMSSSSAAAVALMPDAVSGLDAGGASPGQQALVQAAGPPAPADIRQKVNADAAVESNGSLTDKLMFWHTRPPPGITVDPTKEAQRLRENAALGEGVQQGDTPIIQPKSKNLFERIF